jgi:hypothetical protein
MKLPMMTAAQRHRELVTDLAAERAALSKAQVVWIRRTAATDEAGLLGNISDVVAIPYPAGLWQR